MSTNSETPKPLREIIPIPVQQAVLLPLPTLVNLVLGDNHWMPISNELAEAILLCTRNKHTCFVQFPSEDAPHLKVPLLWNYHAWEVDIERTRQSRIRSERERVARWIFNANVEQISKELLKRFSLTEDQAALLARRWMTGGKWEQIKSIGIKLKTKEEEL